MTPAPPAQTPASALAAGGAAGPTKTRAAGVSIASNTGLIVLKVAAGLVTGSVGLLSDAVHSLMDLIASLIAWASVRKADAPADASHRYGHEKLEDLSAGAQALLLLFGAAFIAVEAARRLINGGHLDKVGIGIVVAGLAAVVNLVVSTYLARAGRSTGSPALHANAADLRTDAIVSLAVFVSLIVITLTGAGWIDPIVGLLVAAAIGRTGLRILVDASRRLADEALPPDELAALQQVVESTIGDEVVGYHDLRARHVGSHHQVDLHLQFGAGTSLERAHYMSHQLQDRIVARLPGTTVLVHLEPEDRVRPDRFEHAPDVGDPLTRGQ
ncbi:MAG: cation diffusion facilitator family transporter [Solirubrobacteraceae bacterium]